jgi:hypothetical protein
VVVDVLCSETERTVSKYLEEDSVKSLIAALAMAGAAGAIVLAPVAAAAPTTTNTGGATVVQTPGNAQVTAQPGGAALQAGQLQYPFFGYGVPGIVFHH